MSIETLERAIARLEELKAGTYDIPWVAVGSGPAPGDHWTVHESGGEYLALIATQDGVNEPQREPTAELIVALSRCVDPLLSLFKGHLEWVKQDRYCNKPGVRVLALARAILGEQS